MGSEAVRDEEMEIVWRRFGPKHKRPCLKPNTITCAMWKCQAANVCEHSPEWHRAYHDAIARLRPTRSGESR